MWAYSLKRLAYQKTSCEIAIGNLSTAATGEFYERKNIKMTGLRIYIRLVRAETIACENVFYSRRGNGPIYRWICEKSFEHWSPLRMHTYDVDSSELRLAAWKSVPEKLQVKLGEHYLD